MSLRRRLIKYIKVYLTIGYHEAVEMTDDSATLKFLLCIHFRKIKQQEKSRKTINTHKHNVRKKCRAGFTAYYLCKSGEGCLCIQIFACMGFLGGASGKEPSLGAGDLRDKGTIPGSGKAPGGGHGNTFQYSCLEKPMDRGAWRATVHRVAKSWT